MMLLTTSGGRSLLPMSRPMNREVVPARTRDESGQYMLTSGQVMEVPRTDALLRRGGSPHQAEMLLIPGSERQLPGGGSLQAAREMEHLELELIPTTEIQDDVGSQTDAFNDLPHQEEPPVEWVINVGEMIENSEEAPASMLNHGQMNAIVKKLTEVVKDLSSDKEELRKILLPLCGAMNIALPTLKFSGYLNDHSIIPPLEFVGIVNLVAFAGFMAGFSLDTIAPKIANFSTQSGIALTTVSVFSLSSWIFSVKAIVVPAFFGVLALGAWGISRFIRGLGGTAA